MKEYGMEPQGVEWFTAWDLVDPKMKEKKDK